MLYSFIRKIPKNTWISLGLIVLIVILFTPWAALNRFEDFLITLRFARNAATGRGAVFSDGQVAQGFTSPLQFLLGFVLCFLGLGTEAVPALICLLGLSSILLLAFNLAYWISGRFLNLTTVVSCCVFFSSTLLFMCVGFDSVWAIGLVATGITLFFSSRYKASAGVAALAVLARPDAALLVILLGMILIYRRAWRTLLISGSLFSSLILPWYAFSQVYYGSVFPRTLWVKLEQGNSGIPIFDQTLSQAFQRSFSYFPLSNRSIYLTLALLGLVAFGMIFLSRKNSGEMNWISGIRQKSPHCIQCLAVFFLFVAAHFFSYFVLMTVPANYPWYHIYLSSALLALVGFIPMMMTVSEKVDGKAEVKIAPFGDEGVVLKVRTVFSMLAVCWALLLVSIHYVYHIPRDNPGRHRYVGYRAAAEWMNRHADEQDIVHIAEVGVFGWYCPLNIEDYAGLTMGKPQDRQWNFRYAVRAVNPGGVFVPDRLVANECDLRATFLCPNGVQVYVYERRSDPHAHE